MGPTSLGYSHPKGHRSAHFRPNQSAYHRPIPTQYGHVHHQYPQPTFWCPQTIQPHVQAIQTPPPFNSRPPQYRASCAFTNLGMSLSRAFEKLLAARKIAPLPPKQLPNPLPPNFRLNQYCAYHQSTRNLIDDCSTLRNAIEDLLRKRVIVLEPPPDVTTNPLPTHITTPPPANLNLIDLDDPLESSIYMISWDTQEPRPITLIRNTLSS